MDTHADKTQEDKSQSISSNHSQIQSGGESTFQFVDKRPEAVAQRKLQEMANNSPQVSQLRAFQEMANNSPQAKQSAQLQAMANNHSSKEQQPFQKKENNTGLPDNLKTGMENLSWMSLDDVKVHHNSDKPAQLQAHAYAQGTDIHLGPGQEKHLPHELGHVVQQKEGRVKATTQMKGKVAVNDDAGLEKEADMLGFRALSPSNMAQGVQLKAMNKGSIKTIQRKSWDITPIQLEKYKKVDKGRARPVDDSYVLKDKEVWCDAQGNPLNEVEDDLPIESGETSVSDPPSGYTPSFGPRKRTLPPPARPESPASSRDNPRGRSQRDDHVDNAEVGPEKEFRLWLRDDFDGDVTALDRIIETKARAEKHHVLYENGYKDLSRGDKMDLFQALDRLTMKGRGASIDVSQSHTCWEYLTGGGHWEWAPFAKEIRKLNGSSAIKAKAAASRTDIPGINSIKALDTVSAFSSAIGALKETLNKEAIKQAISNQAFGPEDDNFQTFATITRNVKLLALVALRITQAKGDLASRFAGMLPGLGFVIAVAEAGSMASQIVQLNNRIGKLEELQSEAKKIPQEIYTRALQNAKLERGATAAKAASIAISIASTAAGLALTGPASLGVGFGLAALALAVGGVVQLVSYFKNISNQEIAARSLLARIHGKKQVEVTDKNQNEFLQEIGYASGTLLVFWNEYLVSYSEELFSLAKDKNPEALALLEQIGVNVDNRRFSAKSIKAKL
jgi:hypothetical protein